MLQHSKCGTVLPSQYTLWKFTCFGASLFLIYFMYLWFTIGNKGKYADPQSYKEAFYVRKDQNFGIHVDFFNQRAQSAELRKEDKFNLRMSLNSKTKEYAEEKNKLQEIATHVKKIAETVSICKEVPGMTMAMVKGEHSVLVSLGKADIASGRPVTKETKFLMNSMTKTFLGQLLAVLISEASKNISWDTRVKDILGSDFQLATVEVTEEVTLRDLLSHRSGLSSGNLAVRSTYPHGWTKAELVKQLHHLPVSVPFRRTFLYSNMASMLVAHITEKLGGASWDLLMVDKLLKPLEMSQSRPLISHKELEGSEFARPYVPVDGNMTACDTRLFNQGPLSAVCLLTSNAEDMVKWIHFNLKSGCLKDGRELIRYDIWREMWRHQIGLSPMFLKAVDKSSNHWPVKDVSEGYGLFWFLNKYRGFKLFWHGGGLYSHYTLAWIIPEKQVGLYISINGYSGNSKPFSIVESLAYYATDHLLGYQSWLDQKSICDYPSSWSNGTKLSSEHGMAGWMKDPRQEASLNEPNADTAAVDTKVASYEQKHDSVMSNGQELRQEQNSSFPAFSYSKFKRSVEFGPARYSKDTERVLSPRESKRVQRTASPLPAKSYEGLYFNPLFGNLTFFGNATCGCLQCKMIMLTGILRPLKVHTFEVELTESLRFLSKPSKHLPPQPAFKVDFTVDSGDVTGVDVHSGWSMEVPIHFVRKFR